MLLSSMNPALVVFLIDRSGSMSTKNLESGMRLSEIAANGVNNALYDLALAGCVSNGEIRDRVHISAFGYGDRRSPDLVNWALDSVSEGEGWVTADDWVTGYSGLEEVVVTRDGGKEITMQMPIWVSPLSEGRTAMATAFRRAGRVIADHMTRYPNSESPIVINITDGHPGDVKTSSEIWHGLQEAADSIHGRIGRNGPPIMLNVHLDPQCSEPLIFPFEEPPDSDRYARNMYRISSLLPERMVHNARARGFDLRIGARGLIINAGPELLSSFLEFGTSYAPPPPA